MAHSQQDSSSEPTFKKEDDESRNIGSEEYFDVEPTNDVADDKLNAAEKESRSIVQQLDLLCAAEGCRLQASHHEAFQKMLSIIPREILDMQLGDFLDACEDENTEEDKWGQTPF